MAKGIKSDLQAFIATFLNDVEIKFSMPGRVRFKLNFAGDDVLYDYLRREIHRVFGARLKSYSAFSRTVLVTYDLDLVKLEAIISALFKGIESYFISHSQCIVGEAHLHKHSKSSSGNSICGDSCSSEPLISPMQIRKELGKLCQVGAIAGYLIIKRVIRGKNAISPPFLFMSMLITVIAGRTILKNGFNTLRKGQRPNDDTLVSLAVISALILRDGLTSLSIMWLINVGRFLERVTLLRAQSAIKDLLDITPKEANLILGERVQSVPVGEVTKGQFVRVFASFSVPLDGKITRGCGAFQESALTGESLPIEKTIGDFVYAGTIVLSGEVDVEVVNVESETAVAKMIASVEQMRNKRGKIELYGEKFVSKFIPISIGTSVLIFLITKDWQRAIASLVIACPCAVGLATPAAVAAGITEAAKKGILIKGGTHLEAASNVSAVVFDKTGTLTSGSPSVSQVYFSPDILSQLDETELWSIVGGCEKYSTHPLAKALMTEASKRTSFLKEPSNYQNLPGRGIVAEVNTDSIALGNLKMLQELEINVPSDIASILDGSRFALLTTVFVVVNKDVVGIIGVEDKVRPEALRTIQQLRGLGISKIVLASGDKKRVVEALAEKLGITEFVAEALPQDKCDLITDLRKEHRVLMVGDGVNDAQALAAADISMAQGSGRCDLAIETADITLAQDNLYLVPQTIEISRKTYKTIEQNFMASVGVNVVGLLIGASGVLSPFSAALVHNLSTIAVIANSLRLKMRISHMKEETSNLSNLGEKNGG